MLLFAARFRSRCKSRLDSLVLLSARTDGWCGISLAPQRGSNASIESAGPMGWYSYHSTECADGQTGYLSHMNLCHVCPPYLRVLLLLIIYCCIRVVGLCRAVEILQPFP